jgi:tetratricopeptide (TPR) repeat protein
MEMLTNFKEKFSKGGRKPKEGRKRRFSFIRIFLFLLFFVLVVGSFLAVKMMESLFTEGQKSKVLITKGTQSVLNDFSVAKNQTNEMKKEEVAHNGNFTNATTISADTTTAIANATAPPLATRGSATNKTQPENKLQPKKLRSKTYFQKKKMQAKSLKKTIEEKPSQKDTPSEEKTVKEKEDFSLVRGEKKLENLLLKAEEETARGNYQLAKFFYEKYLEEKKDPQVYNNYGGVLFLLGNYEEAEKAFAMALSLESNPAFRLNLILTKIKRNQIKEACQMFKKFQKELSTFEEGAFIKNICFS